jgi:putative transposase
MVAAGGFARDEKNTAISKRLRVSVRSVEPRRRSWREGGWQALRPSGPVKRPRADDGALAVLDPLRVDGETA